MYDVTIIGGGPAGLSAALLLGRCMRKVVLFDSGSYRNSWSDAMNGFLSRDGTNPREFLKMGRADLDKYEIEFKQKTIVKARLENNLFEVTDTDDQIYLSRKLLIATGVRDRWPDNLPGIEPFKGKSIHHCPYCDGWESRNKPLGAYGLGRDAVGLSLSLKTWSSDVTLFTNGTRKLTKEDSAKLERNHVKICTAPIERLEGEGTELKQIILQGGSMPCEALFFSTGADQQCNLTRELGCDFTSKGVVKTYQQQQTNIKGLYVAGDAARDMQLVIVAAAEGTKAGVMINKELQEEFRL